MLRPLRRTLVYFLPLLALPAFAQKPLSWEEVRERFRSNNPSLLAGETFVDENRANEVTAGLRPNPQLAFTVDQWKLFSGDPYRPLGAAQSIAQVSQLIERRNKRGLRVESAKLATSISGTDLADLERQLLFALRDAFVRTLQSKSILELAEENLRAYDKVIDISRKRFDAGDMSRSDFDRIGLQRAQFESDLANAMVNLRTAKIQVLALLNDKTPVDNFELAGAFDFGDKILLPEELHQAALDARGDVRSATTAMKKAETDNRLAWANGSTDPIVGADYTRIGPDNTVGLALTIPLRIYDKNQGEKARTALEIRRTEQAREAILAGVNRDIDSAYAAVESVRTLLRPYRDRYLPQAERVRESVSYAYSKGGATLLDFLDAQKSYRDAQLTYRNLIATYLSAVNQLNLAVGREVLQ